MHIIVESVECTSETNVTLSAKYTSIIILFFFNLSLLILKDRGNETQRVEEEHREGERERIPSRIHTVSTEPDAGVNPTNCEITTGTKIKSQMLNRLSHSSTPNINFLM